MKQGDIGEHWAIGPFIGIARVGNSPHSFYLEPERAGALPIEVDVGDVAMRDSKGGYKRVAAFKDGHGLVRRQAARFRIFHKEGGHWRPVGKADGLRDIEWTVHLANKKACWYEFSELRGDAMYPGNAYDDPKRLPVKRRNAHVADRGSLIIDFGERRVSRRGQAEPFKGAPQPARLKHGDAVDSLGEIRLNAQGELLVLGAHGKAGGEQSIKSFGGADGWRDDVADGPVTCRFRTATGDPVVLRGWVIVGSPKFAPEIVNIVTLADVMEDVAIRCFKGYREDVYDKVTKKFIRGRAADFERDIRPILERPAGYRWVANIPVLQSVSRAPLDDVRDNSKGTPAAALRRTLFQLYRRPNRDDAIDPSHNELLPIRAPAGAGNFPAMPLNSGSNSVGNDKGLIDKFLSLTQTQHFMLQQWADGNFTKGAVAGDHEDPWSLTLGSLGNCVGSPLCPGIEVTWTVRDRNIYAAALQIRHRKESYPQGLDPDRDETVPKPGDEGCEPGDLTKRMAIPWQADFFACSTQYINYTDSKTNSIDGIPPPPTYYAHWWPPQSPWQVITGDPKGRQQAIAGTPSGAPVQFTRGINSFDQMLIGWSYLGFIMNQTQGALREHFPNFTEQDRDHKRFIPASTAIGSAGDVTDGSNATFNGSWILRESLDPPVRSPATAMPTSRRRGRKPNTP